jgi:hypothetical protein
MSLRKAAATIHAAIVEVDCFAMYPAIRGTWTQLAIRDALRKKAPICRSPSCRLHPCAHQEVYLRPMSVRSVEQFDGGR